MATYPGGIYSPRTKENKSGVVYDAAKKTTLFAEDITKDDDEIVAIETELGTNPKGDYADVKTLLTYLTDVKKSKAYFNRATTEQVLTAATWLVIWLNHTEYDINDEVNNTEKSGAATATTALHLIDTTADNFTAEDVGRRVWNTTDNTYATVTVFNSSSDLTLSADIMANLETYVIYFSRFTVKQAGYYLITAGLKFRNAADGENCQLNISVNGSTKLATNQRAGAAGDVQVSTSFIKYLAVNDYVEMKGNRAIAGNIDDVIYGTFLSIHRLS